MLTIKVPATTSNLGVGFDTLGMALNIYNVFGFTETKEYKVVGFDAENTKNNLVLQSYISFCLDNGLPEEDIQKVAIEVIENSIPIARGLGSSATCIIAGVIAANEINHLDKSITECATYASKKEGHPDNAFSTIKGGFNATFNHEGKYVNQVLKVSKNLYFTLLVPNNTGKTEELRSILPKNVALTEAVYNLSRIVQLPMALEQGDFESLQLILTDKLHEQYRSTFIPQYDEVKKISIENNIICLISGSGPTLFLVSESPIEDIFNGVLDTFVKIDVSIANGTTWECVK